MYIGLYIYTILAKIDLSIAMLLSNGVGWGAGGKEKN